MVKKIFNRTVAIIEKRTGLYFSSFAKNGTWMLLSYFSGVIFALGTSYCFAHFLSSEEYGTYKYILSLSGLVGAFTLTGMNTAVMRAISNKDVGVYRASVHYQLRWNAFVFLASCIPVIIYGILGDKTIAIALLIVSSTTMLLTAFNTYSAYLNGRKEFRNLTRYSIISSLSQSIIVVIMIFISGQALWIIAGSFLAQVILTYLFHRKVLRQIPAEAISNQTGEHLRFGRILSLNNIVKLISDQADKFIVFSFLGPTQLAIYAFAQALPDQIRAVFKIVPPVTFPHLAERETNDLPKTFWKYMQYLLIASIASVLLYNIFAYPVFKLLFNTYIVSIPYSRVLSLTMIPVVLALPLSTFINARGRTKASTSLNTATSVNEIGCLLLGGYLFGFWGIVFGKLISASLTLFVSLYLVKSAKA